MLVGLDRCRNGDDERIRRLRPPAPASELLGSSALMVQVRAAVDRAAPAPFAVLRQPATKEQLVHNLTIKCPAGSIPGSIKVDVSGLKVDEGLHVRDLVLPQGVVVADAEPDLLLVHVVLRTAGDDAEAGAESSSQPEVIKPERKEKDKAD